jgi:hypothetical protein
MSVVTTMTPLICCDGCGVVAVAHAPRWRTWTGKAKPVFRSRAVARRHHCPSCAENNELLATGLVYGRAPAEAIVYDEPVPT